MGAHLQNKTLPSACTVVLAESVFVERATHFDFHDSAGGGFGLWRCFVPLPPTSTSRLPAAFTEWAPLAQDRAGWQKLVTEPPFKLGKQIVRQPRGDTRVTPEGKQRLAEQRAAEIAKRRADFNATNN